MYSEYDTPYLAGRAGMTLPLLSPVVLHKEFTNTLNKTGPAVLKSANFVQDHSVVFWNLVLYFKVMKLPCFLLDLDYSKKHVKVQVSWILKYLPASASTSKQVTRSSFGSGGLSKDVLKKLDSSVKEASPARNSSIQRMA